MWWRMKRGQLVWDTISKWIIALVFLVIVVLILFTNREKLVELTDNVRLFLRFG